MTHRQTPGPIGTSCLTCKHRRKKCDRSRPTCERCRIGEFECLGYGHNDKGLVNSPRESSQQEDAIDGSFSKTYRSSTIQYPDGAHPAAENSSRMLSLSTLSHLKEQPVTYDTYASRILSDPLAPHLNDYIMHIPNTGEDISTKHGTLFSMDSQQLPPACQTYSAAHSFTSTLGESDGYFGKSSQIASLPPYTSVPSQYRGQYVLPIPHSVPLEPTNIVNIIGYVLAQYERLVTLSHFRPLSQQRARMRQLISWRLQSPNNTRWAMYMGARIFESLIDGVLPERVAVYGRWIQRFERELRVIPNRELTNDEIQNRLCGELEVSLVP
ncbi:hypothetical protein BDV93DRAFT_363554 [Ceratobasidium sp. AG-I]|nr:hypothetical protein BDV93DRAFT_363554 [Ceratobasidium sp. AG-I]